MNIHFAHPAYQLEASFLNRDASDPSFQTWTPEDTVARLGEAEVFVGSGYWRNEYFEAAPNLKYIHACAAGYDNFDLEIIKSRGIRLTNSSGVNVNAVSDHGMALTRQIHTARDRQHKKQWRGMISDIPAREDELAGKTLLIYGLGGIGGRLARLAKAFEMTVVGIKRGTSEKPDHVDALHPPAEFPEMLKTADVVALTCPLTDATRGLMNSVTLACMKPSAYLINLARGPVVNEADIVAALKQKLIAGAGLDVFDPEPLPENSKLWGFENVVITPHTAGETQRYEENVVDFLMENLARLARGETELVNQIV